MNKLTITSLVATTTLAIHAKKLVAQCKDLHGAAYSRT